MTVTLVTKTRGMLQIFRPELPFAAGVCVVLGEIVALGGFPSGQSLLAGFLCGFFLSGSAIVLNDYFDLEVDRVNAPDRPLPAGTVTPLEAILLSLAAAGAGLAAAYRIGISALLLCIFFWWIGFLYNWKFKEAGLLGNLMVSTSVGITFILGGLAAGQAWNPIVWCFAAMAFFIDLGEEIAGDAMDIEGDKKRGSRSIAIVRGRGFALWMSGLFFGIVVLISFLPVLFGWTGVTYLLLIVVTDGLIAVFTFRLLKSRSPEEGRRAMRGIYLGALFGLLAAVLGQIVR